VGKTINLKPKNVVVEVGFVIKFKQKLEEILKNADKHKEGQKKSS
jgi:hypothetical protein